MDRAIRGSAGSARRKSFEELFFDGDFRTPLGLESAGAWSELLDCVRAGPSASNKQPWRVVRQGYAWHFYCQHTAGYGKGSLVFNLLGLADLQRLDLGIAMCHFDLTNHELGLNGYWSVTDPGLQLPDEKTVYIATWQLDSSTE